MDITFWRTRDGEEVDFLVEAGGVVAPVKVKLGTPEARSLPRLDRMAGTSWQPGRAVSLTSLDPAAQPVALAKGWFAGSPLDLTFLDR